MTPTKTVDPWGTLQDWLGNLGVSSPLSHLSLGDFLRIALDAALPWLMWIFLFALVRFIAKGIWPDD